MWWDVAVKKAIIGREAEVIKESDGKPSGEQLYPSAGIKIKLGSQVFNVSGPILNFP